MNPFYFLVFALTLTSGFLSLASEVAYGASAATIDSVEMHKARAALKHHHGNQINSLVLGERFEYQSNGEEPLQVWEAQGWIGGDTQKLWFKTQGDYSFGDSHFDDSEVQSLYSRAISPFWDFQAGLRYNITPDRTYATLGFQGLAPYWFELDGALFLSSRGDLSLRLEAEYEFRITQRVLLQPRLELNGAFSSDKGVSSGSGLSSLQSGLRLRYELSRQFAPYLGVTWYRSFGKTREFQKQEEEDIGQLSFVAGLRFWF